MNVPYLPESAPFSPEQRAWLNGFLAGAFARRSADATDDALAAPTPKVPVTLLWGSQTGNAETLAKSAKKHLEASGAEVTVFDLADYPFDRLPTERNLLLLTSTYGEGEPPDNARAFHQALLAESAPRLQNTRFAVFALGDTNYPDFCQTGKEFDARLEALGAHRWTPRVDVDVDFDEPFETWLKTLSADLGPTPSQALPSAEPTEAAAPVYSRKKPFPARLLTNRCLNGPGSAKDTRHFELSLAGSNLDYAVGDALGVFPRNDPATVEACLAAVGFAPDHPIATEENQPLRGLLARRYDLKKLTLPFLQACAATPGASAELLALAQRCSEDRAAFETYAEGRELLDVLTTFQPHWPTPEAFLASLKKIAPRLYSISSSPKAHPGEVHLTVGVVRYTAHGQARTGMCSNFLAEIAPGSDEPIDVFLHANKTFKPPADSTVPMIMIGPGTGLAPFRAFLEERAAAGATGDNWLFFGDQHAATDFLYADEIQAWQASGLLSRLDTAFSRDQAKKVYVQDRLLAAGAEVARWLDRGAHFYVCGDASRMAKDVDQALRTLTTTHLTDGDPTAANALVDSWIQSKRYVRDVY